MKKWKCSVCGHVYDPVQGDADGEVPPGTAFEAVPRDWTCPECGAPRSAYHPLA